jgi:hypothetical protein
MSVQVTGFRGDRVSKPCHLHGHSKIKSCGHGASKLSMVVFHVFVDMLKGKHICRHMIYIQTYDIHTFEKHELRPRHLYMIIHVDMEETKSSFF